MSQESPVGEKHHKRPHKNQSVGHNCILCCSASDNKSRPFQYMTYGRNDMLADILHGKNLLGGAIICLRCNIKLIQNMFVSCCICENVVKWKSTLIFKRSQYSTDGIHQALYSIYVKCATVTWNPHICVYAARDI